MSIFRTAAVAALALSLSATAFANENDSPNGSPFGNGVSISRGANGVGLAGENVSATGNVFAQSIPVTHGQLAGLAESLALTNNAGASELNSVNLGGQLAAR